MLKNVNIYKLIQYSKAAILFWTVQVLFYNYRGLSFFDISLIQSVGAICSAIFEIPMGILSDKKGYKKVLKIGSVSRLISVIIMIFSYNVGFFLVSEILFVLGDAAESGADTALMYESLKYNDNEDDYLKILATIRKNQSKVRVVSRMLSSLIYKMKPVIPFIISSLIYFMIVVCTWNYKEIEEINNKEKSDLRYADNKFKIPFAYWECAIIAAIVLVGVSNYSQFFGAYLKELKFDISFLGIITAIACLFEYLGIKLLIKKDAYGRYYTYILAILITGLISCPLLIKTYVGAILVYYGISFFHAPFGVIINANLQNIVSSEKRATLLSIANQINQVLSIICDPFVGLMMDYMGFGRTYFFVSIIMLGMYCVLVCIGIIINGSQLIKAKG